MSIVKSDVNERESIDALERLETKAANHKAAILLLLDEATDIRLGITAIVEVFQEYTGELRGQIPCRLHDALPCECKSLKESSHCSKGRSRDFAYPLVESLKRQESC
jgi:hypothetical protein